MLSPLWRTRVFALGGAITALWLGAAIARGEMFWPGIVGAGLLGLIFARGRIHPPAALVLAAALFGYVAGNRGFAQLSVLPSFPLLPAEAALLAGAVLLAVNGAWRRELPVRREALDLAIAAWMTLGTVRVGFDVRHFGFAALRDYALVYYAGFYFLAREAARTPASARFLRRTLLVAIAVMLPLYELQTHAPEVFLDLFVWRNTPWILYKDDLAGTFLAAGSVWFFLCFEARPRPWPIALSLACAVATLTTGNRASALGLVIAAGWLAIRGRWRFGVLLGAGGAAAAVAIVLGALALRIPWERTPVYFAYEQIASLADPHGHRSYTGESTFNKGDNNRFRWVWWQSAVGETIDGGPWLGLGFGYDLADQFVREFYPEDTDEFTTRSPHNVLVTIFARMGAVGLAAFLTIVAVMAARTWRAIARGPDEAAPWCAAWTVLTSACFGVVLEGPMGAVVFWTLLGLGQAGLAQPADETPGAAGSEQTAQIADDPAAAGEIAANS